MFRNSKTPANILSLGAGLQRELFYFVFSEPLYPTVVVGTPETLQSFLGTGELS